MNGNGVDLFKDKKVAILYSDAKREYFPTDEQYITEAEVFGRAQAIVPYFEKLGCVVDLIPGNDELAARLQKNVPDFALNLVDSVRGKENLAASIPATLDLLNIPYLGAGMLGLAINSNKFLTKKLLEQWGIPQSRYQLFTSPSDPLDSHLKFPLISKLNEVHGRVSIDQDAVSENEAHLRARVRDLMSVYNQPVLVEEFIVGKELTVIVLDGMIKKLYTGEIIFSDSNDKYKIATFSSAWEKVDTVRLAKIESNGILDGYVRSAFDLLKMCGYGKFDIRQDESGRYYFIDCNANSMFGPVEKECDISLLLKLYGIEFEEIIRRLVLGLKGKGLFSNNYVKDSNDRVQ